LGSAALSGGNQLKIKHRKKQKNKKNIKIKPPVVQREGAQYMYHKCSKCGKDGVLLKCACLKATYYCDAACQKAHYTVHRLECSKKLLDKIGKTQARLDAFTATDTGAQPCVVLKMQQALAILHSSIGRIMGGSQQPQIYGKAIAHCREALLLHRKVRSFCETATGSTLVCARGIVAPPTVVDSLYDTMQHIIDVLRLGQQYAEAFEMLTILLGELRAHISHDTSPKLVVRLGFILVAQANVHIHQHHDTVHYNTRVTNNEHCHAAIELLQEAITLWRLISCNDKLAYALLHLATAFNDLRQFARSGVVLQESLALAPTCRDGIIHVAACHQQIAFNCLGQAMLLRKHLYAHRMFLLSDSMTYYHQPLQTVRICGLLNQPQYNGFEAMVTHVGTDLLTVCLQGWRYEGELRNIKPENIQPFLRTAAELQTTFKKIQGGRDEDKLIKIKPQNAKPMICTAADLQTTFAEIQQLTAAQIKSSAKSHEIQLGLTGDKHVNAAITCYTLATAYMKTYHPQDTRKALELLNKADFIRRKIGDEHVERSKVFPALIKEAEQALADFEGPDFLSPVPCCWPASSRKQDEQDIRQLFSKLQTRHNNRTYIPYTDTLHSLHLYGISGVAASGPNTVGCKQFVNIACNALQTMKDNANTNDAAQSTLPDAMP